MEYNCNMQTYGKKPCVIANKLDSMMIDEIIQIWTAGRCTWIDVIQTRRIFNISWIAKSLYG